MYNRLAVESSLGLRIGLFTSNIAMFSSTFFLQTKTSVNIALSEKGRDVLQCHFSTHACALFAFIIEPATTDTELFLVTNLFDSSLLSQVVRSELSHVEVT
jgi:hypothetical protein